MSAQQSFDALLQRFRNGNTLIQGWSDYNPGNTLITKANLTTFITSVETANTAVTNTDSDLGTSRANRNVMVFQIKDTNPTCLESRIRGIENYLKSDPDNNAFATSAQKVKAILKKIRPDYPKKDPAAPRASVRSPMEKRFTSAVGQGQAVITIITKLGAAYSPADTNLSVANMTSHVSGIETRNSTVQSTLEDNSEAIKARLALYKGPQGLEKRRSAILNYLASFPGLKKSSHYVEYNKAIKRNINS